MMVKLFKLFSFFCFIGMVPNLQALDAPTNLKAQPFDTTVTGGSPLFGIQVTWAGGYSGLTAEVYRSETSNFWDSYTEPEKRSFWSFQDANDIANPNYPNYQTIPVPERGRKYYYWVRFTDPENGLASDLTGPVSATVPSGSQLTPTLSLSTGSLSFPSTSGTKSFTLNASNLSGEWTYLINQPTGWRVTVATPPYQGNGINEISIWTEQNTSSNPRSGSITFTYPGATSQTLNFTQAAATPTPSLSISPTLLELGNQSIYQGISLNASSLIGNWTATTNEDWITEISPSSGGSGNGISVGFTVAANTGPSERTGQITFSSPGATTRILTIRQDGGAALVVDEITSSLPSGDWLYVNNRNYTQPISVSLSTNTPDAAIRYTLDGSTPSQASLLYTGPIQITQAATLKARAFKDGYTPSPEASWSFGLNYSPTQPCCFDPLSNDAENSLISWQRSADADRDALTYIVEYSVAGSGNWVRVDPSALTDGGLTLSAKLSSLTPDEIYSVRIKAIESAALSVNLESTYYTGSPYLIGNFRTRANGINKAPVGPFNLSVDLSSAEANGLVYFDWIDAWDPETGQGTVYYEIEVWEIFPNETLGERIPIGPTSDRTIAWDGFLSNHTYGAQVRAVDPIGKPGTWASARFTVPDFTNQLPEIDITRVKVNGENSKFSLVQIPSAVEGNRIEIEVRLKNRGEDSGADLSDFILYASVIARGETNPNLEVTYLPRRHFASDVNSTSNDMETIRIYGFSGGSDPVLPKGTYDFKFSMQPPNSDYFALLLHAHASNEHGDARAPDNLGETQTGLLHDYVINNGQRFSIIIPIFIGKQIPRSYYQARTNEGLVYLAQGAATEVAGYGLKAGTNAVASTEDALFDILDFSVSMTTEIIPTVTQPVGDNSDYVSYHFKENPVVIPIVTARSIAPLAESMAAPLSLQNDETLILAKTINGQTVWEEELRPVIADPELEPYAGIYSGFTADGELVNAALYPDGLAYVNAPGFEAPVEASPSIEGGMVRFEVAEGIFSASIQGSKGEILSGSFQSSEGTKEVLSQYDYSFGGSSQPLGIGASPVPDAVRTNVVIRGSDADLVHRLLVTGDLDDDEPTEYKLAFDSDSSSWLIDEEGELPFSIDDQTEVEPGIWSLELVFQTLEPAMFIQLKSDYAPIPEPEPLTPRMVLVEGGTMEMSMGTETVDSFFIGKYEVTWGEWKRVRTWAVANGYDLEGVGEGCADDHPVHSVSWFDVVKWCNAKSEMEGLMPVYTANNQVLKMNEPDHTSISQNLSANGYRLPMEAEWEFAARGGNQTNGYTYSGSNDLNEVGWYRDNSGGAACNLFSSRGAWPVGQKAANELGLYDMSGNVWEWCFNRIGSSRRFRGGNWNQYAQICTVSIRDSTYPGYSGYGFRIARSSPLPRDGMVRVEGGTLPASSVLGEVAVSAFYIGQYEVTWGEWKDVQTWAATNGYDIGSRGDGCADDHPVHSVAWYDVVKWCNAKSEMEGLTPIYSFNGSTYKSGEPTHTAITQNLAANGYRLPQEAEWEFAARGGNQTNGHTYSGSNDLNAVGWYRDNSGGAACNLSSGRGTWPVGQKAANELGLYDMSGNVWEWCWDRSGSYGNFRGGSWAGFESLCTVSEQFGALPDHRSIDIGFRVAYNSGQ